MAGKVTRIIIRNGTEAEWSPAGDDALIGIGEIGYENDTNRLKIGHGTPDADGLVKWNDCEYITDVVGVVDDYTNIIELTDDGLLYASGSAFDTTELEERIERIEDKVPTQAINVSQEIDGGRLISVPNSKVLFNFPSIKLRPLALKGLAALTGGASAEDVLTTFFEDILGFSIDPNILNYTIMESHITPLDLDVRLPVLNDADVKYVDWGDGTVEENGGNATHDYTAPGDYTITAIFEWNNSNNILNFSQINKLNWMTDVIQFGIADGHTEPKLGDGRGAFFGFAGQHISAFDRLNFGNITETTRMFSRATRFNQNINKLFEEATITNTYGMFNEATSYNNDDTPIPFDQLSDVTFITSMFQASGVNDTTLQNVETWDVGKVQDEPFSDPVYGTTVRGGMRELFERTVYFNKNENFDLSGWNVSTLDEHANLYHGQDPNALVKRQNFSTPNHEEAFLPQFGQP